MSQLSTFCVNAFRVSKFRFGQHKKGKDGMMDQFMLSPTIKANEKDGKNPHHLFCVDATQNVAKIILPVLPQQVQQDHATRMMSIHSQYVLSPSSPRSSPSSDIISPADPVDPKCSIFTPPKTLGSPTLKSRKKYRMPTIIPAWISIKKESRSAVLNRITAKKKEDKRNVHAIRGKKSPSKHRFRMPTLISTWITIKKKAIEPDLDE